MMRRDIATTLLVAACSASLLAQESAPTPDAEPPAKGLKIRARKGYYAPTADGSSVVATRQGVDPVIQTALDSPWAEDGIPLRMTHYVGAAQDANGMPQVVQGYKVERSDGVSFFGTPESLVQPTSLGALSSLIGISLQNAMPGDYEIQLTLRDELSRETIELQEPFSVVPAEPAEGANGPTASSP